ncbi:nucleoside transmembrane transporter [Martiniozyma asiatica (nom. inval.)]|nr:nucleoside transmembrane transporter [Martiniozyma asiatica]
MTAFTKDDTILFHVLSVPVRLSTVKYATFLLCGVSSLWPWNCFLSASDYFQDRFALKPSLSSNYSSTMMTISTLTSTVCNYILSQRQKGVNYTKRLKMGNLIQIFIFFIMALSIALPQSWVIFYFIFVMVNVAYTSIGSCLTQVGMMALVNIQGSWYANATVVGNAIAGVLPSMAMIIAVLTSKEDLNTLSVEARSSEAITYFLTSVLMATAALASIWIMEYCERKIYNPDMNVSTEQFENEFGESTPDDSVHVGFGQLWSKLNYVETTIMLTFSITLVFPVFASVVESSTIDKKVFIPLAFLVWNLGDLAGRILCAVPFFIVKSNRALLGYSLLRFLFVPLFMMCNIKGAGSTIGDFGYLMLQLLFGLTNGQLFSSSYMRVGQLLDNQEEQKAAAGFTALIINISLLGGSLASFLVVWLCS